MVNKHSYYIFMSSFSSKSVYSRNNIQNKYSPGIGFFIGFIVILGLFLFYLVWSVWSITVWKGKYTIEKWYTTSVLSDKLWFPVASWRYRFWTRLFAPSSIVLSAWTYETNTPVSISDFLTKTIKTPLYKDQTITILPGWNSYDIDAYLASKDIGRVWDFLETSRINFWEYQKDFSFLSGVKSLEWFLYPDTYRLRQDATTDDAIRVMLREFGKKIGASYSSLDPKRAYETLILASIVEREEWNAINQPIVAGILAKRVKEGIAMWADATVCYGYAKTQKQCTPSFIWTVIHDKNLYNTRNKLWYTPTPIVSVPLETWNAALHPVSSPYYYYLHGSDGQIHYGRTNDEHVSNKKFLN